MQIALGALRWLALSNPMSVWASADVNSLVNISADQLDEGSLVSICERFLRKIQGWLVNTWTLTVFGKMCLCISAGFHAFHSLILLMSFGCLGNLTPVWDVMLILVNPPPFSLFIAHWFRDIVPQLGQWDQAGADRELKATGELTPAYLLPQQPWGCHVPDNCPDGMWWEWVTGEHDKEEWSKTYFRAPLQGT